MRHALYRAAKADPRRRFHALMDKVFRREVLQHAWVAVRADNGAPGIDKTTLVEVEEYGVDRLLAPRWTPIVSPRPGPCGGTR
ncbi:hypothetical protein [Streptosporangium canum]|uniref:hypothetical protein n=1 Tax=Streptosporangium canum TaxID=324952 RepID=UPI0037987E2B